MENYEQKYKEALKIIESLYNVVRYQSSSDALLASQTIEKAFPELADSEDEKIRKGLIKGLSAMRDIHKHQTFSDDAINIDDAIAWLEKQKDTNALIQEASEKAYTEGMRVERKYWLEKQGEQILANSEKTCKDEQKPTLSEEDKSWFKDIELMALSFSKDDSYRKKFFDWLNSIKNRVQLQPKQEWSEYDKIQLSEAIQMIESNGTWIRSEDAVKKVSNWLKSIKPHWKPSEEQMKGM